MTGQDELLDRAIAELTERHGTVPPPWVVFPDTHPYDIGWRMGGGEHHILVWGRFWERCAWDEEERIAYFRQWPPPPCWLAWMANAVWDLEPWEAEGEFDYAPWFERLERLGFGTMAEYEQDLDDPRWFEPDGIQ